MGGQRGRERHASAPCAATAVQGALLVNLGTPASPRVSDVRRYLRQFLGDPRVIDLAAVPRRLLLELVILPWRPRRSAEAYAKIWTDQGSPLLVHGRALREGVAEELGEAWRVELGMRYGAPSIADAIESLRRAGVERIVALPLFPQYSSAATGSALQALDEATARQPGIDCVVARQDFFEEPGFIASFAAVAKPRLGAFRPDQVLLSYHGLPERQVRRADASGAHCLASDACCDEIRGVNTRCYRAQCYATTRALTTSLQLEPARTHTAFQSRLGRTPWIQPYTDRVLPQIRERGGRRLAVLCPSFVADCLETLEEIGIRARAQWRELGGDELLLVPSLNAEPSWVQTLADWIREV